MLSTKLPWELANPLWAQTLNPVLANPILQGKPLAVTLIEGTVTIPHGLGRMMIGWFQTDINGIAQYYRSKPFNASNLTLTSNAAAIASLWVF